MKVYLTQYNDCIFESSFATLSIHFSKEGAEKTVQEHKDKEYKKWESMDEDYKEDCEFGWDKEWDIKEVEVLP
jgi:hypothetical protein